jgi:hypothetical protein
LSKRDTFRFQRVKENKIIRKCGTHDGEPKNTCRILVGKPEAKTPLGRPGHLMGDCTRMEINENGMDSSGSGLEQVAGSSEHRDRTSNSIKFWEFRGQLGS